MTALYVIKVYHDLVNTTARDWHIKNGNFIYATILYARVITKHIKVDKPVDE